MAQNTLQRLARDRYGYLRDPADWTPALAQELAAEDELQLTDAHFEVMRILQQFHSKYGQTPATRIFTRIVRKELGEQKGNSIYLMKLFPAGAVKQGCKLAGLPRPTQCF